MIDSDATHEEKFKTSSGDPRFDVDAPRTNPLVPNSPLSVTRMDSGVSIAWDVGGPTEAPNEENVFGMAATRARNAMLRFPRSARAHATFGIALAKAGKLDDAIAELREALSVDPGHLVAGLTLGRLLGERGQTTEAKEVYRQLQTRFPTNESVLLSLAYIALLERELDTAAAYVEESLKTNKRLPHAHFLLGLIRLQRGNPRGAIASFREATRLDVRSGALHHALGVAYAIGGDNLRAEKAFRAALTLNPEATPSLHALCETLLAQGRPAEGIDLLRGRVDLQDSLETRDLLARGYISLQRYSNARGQWTHALARFDEQLPPRERIRILNNIAGTFLEEGDSRTAEKELVKALEIESDAPDYVYENLGRVYIRSGRFEDAVEILNRACALYQASQSLRLLLAAAYAHLDQFDEAIRQLEPICEAGDAAADTCASLGWLYGLKNDEDAALSVLSEAYRRYPKDPRVINNLAHTQLRLGRIEEARSVLESFPKGMTPHVELIATRGLLHLLSGDEAGAKFLYHKAETMARESGRSDLAKRVRQKLHLELARVAAKNGDIRRAQTEIRKGMVVKPAVFSYDRQLQQLSQELPEIK